MYVQYLRGTWMILYNYYNNLTPLSIRNQSQKLYNIVYISGRTNHYYGISCTVGRYNLLINAGLYDSFFLKKNIAAVI